MKKLLCLATTIVLSTALASASSITINSGSNVTFLPGPYSTDFSAPFTAADFAAARAGSSAVVQTSSPYWIGSLPAAPSAVWIGTYAGASTSFGSARTALYAVSFNETGPITAASLSLSYAVDNYLGYTNPGIYINGIALPGSKGIGWYTGQYTYTDSSIGADLVDGTNWLYIDAVNGGGPAGLIFSADISANGSASTVPEPSAVLLLLTGLAGFGIIPALHKPKTRSC